MNHPLGFDDADFAMFHELVRQEFIVTADNDYLASRLLAQAGMPRQFCWMANQSLEKYVKALTLITGQRLFFHHKWTDKLTLLNGVFEFPDNISFTTLSTTTALPLQDAAEKIQSFSNPNLRYYGRTAVDTNQVSILDRLVDVFRRNFFVNPWERSEKGLQMLREESGFYFRSRFPFSFENDVEVDGFSFRKAFRQNNATFFEDLTNQDKSFFLNQTLPTLNRNLSKKAHQHFWILHIYENLTDRSLKKQPIPPFHEMPRASGSGDTKS